jgi:glycosyltransferase involved in cell wall biosynthesis
MNTLPQVSVVVPVYNQEGYIRECVESALGQDYEPLEVLVVDDGSTDRTSAILKSFGPRIRYIRQENRGAAAALNHGLRLARGTLVGWLSGDDLYLPGKITAQVQAFQADPSLGLVYTDWVMIGASGQEVQTVRAPRPPAERFVRELLKGNFINGSSVLIKKQCLEKAGYFDETLAADVDGDMWFRLLKHGTRFGHVAQPLLKYRRHPSNLSHRYRLMQAYKDQVRAKVVEAFSREELFAGLIQHDSFDERREYEKLAWDLTKDLNFHAAQTALRKSSRAGTVSLRRFLLGNLLRVMNTRGTLALLMGMRKMKGLILE